MFRKKKAVQITLVDSQPVEKELKTEISLGVHASILIDKAIEGALILMAADTVRKCFTHIVVTKVN